MEVDPVFAIQEEYTDSDQIRHVFIIILPVDVLVLVRLLTLFANDLLQQMTCLLGTVTVRMDPRFLDIVQIIIDKILANLF